MTVDRLSELGHDVEDVRGTADEGLTDRQLWDLEVREHRVLITTDKGFTAYRTASHYGILVVRLRQMNRLKIHQSVMTAIENFDEASLIRILIVIHVYRRLKSA